MKLVKKYWGPFLFTIISTACYEFFLKNSFVSIANWFVEFSAKFSNRLTDYIYSNPSNSDAIIILIPSVFCIMGVLLFFIIRTLQTFDSEIISFFFKIDKGIRTELKKSKYSAPNQISLEFPESENTQNSSTVIAKKNFRKLFKYLRIINLILVSVITITYLVLLSGMIVKYSLKVETERNFLILKPFMDSHQYDVFYSQYLRVQTKQDFIKVQSLLNTIAKKNTILIVDPSK